MRLPSLDRLGMPGIVGLGLMLFCASFYLGSIAPAQAELVNLQREAAQLQAVAGSPGAGAGAGEGEGEGEGGERRAASAALRPLTAFPELLKELNLLAQQHGIAIDRASYALSEREGQRRMEISLPLVAGYPLLRAYLRDLMLLKAPPSLDELSFKRRQAGDPQVEANVRLSYPLAPAP